MITLIIPTFNEAQHIGKLLEFLSSFSAKGLEIIVVDGGSIDDTIEIANEYDVKLITCNNPSRARQMNLGAVQASHDIFYFVHADVIPVPSFIEDIQEAFTDDYQSGCFSCQFVEPALPMLKVNAWFTQLPFRWCRGGDQTLFIKRSLFNDLGGFNEAFVIMEDYEFIDRLLDLGTFKVIKKDVRISARKYENNSYLKVQWINLRAMRMFRRGEDTSKIRDYYLNALK